MESLELHASLPSGRCETVSVFRSGTVGDLKKAVQKSLGRLFLRLAAPNGRLLDDPTESLEQLQDGDTVAVIVMQPKVAATHTAFAMWCGTGNQVVTWGDEKQGGDSSSVQHQLRDVQQIHATDSAFAAILAAGSVVTWGHPKAGGDSARVQNELRCSI